MQVQGKTFILTGASGGIGQALAHQLSSAGARLLLVGRQAQRLAALCASISATADQGPHTWLVADLTLEHDRQQLLKAVQSLGGVDGLINNAGISDFSLVAEQSYEALIQTNLLSPMRLTQLLLPELLQRPQSLILNVGSAFGSIGHAGYSGYCASKFGLRGFTEALKRELADSPIDVLYFAPRATATSINSSAVNALNQHLGNHTDLPEKVAAAMFAQILSGQARCYLGWPEKLFVRLNGLLPGLVDKALAGKLALIRRYAATSTPQASTAPMAPFVPSHVSTKVSTSMPIGDSHETI